jgi:amino acid transporter
MSTSTSSAGPSEGADQLPHRRLPFWVALAMSVALVGPTLAMSGNGQGLIGTVGKAIPLVFVIGLIGVSLVGYSCVRLTRHLNHAGSAYGLVGGTIGPRTGFFSGFAMLVAYVGFATARWP